MILIILVLELIIVSYLVAKITVRYTEAARKRAEEYFDICIMLNQWIQLKQKGKAIEDFLVERKYKKISIYGMGYIAETLMQELQNENIKIVYGIDILGENLYMDIPVYGLEEKYPEADVIIVSIVNEFEKISEQLKNRTSIPIISLKDIIWEISMT